MTVGVVNRARRHWMHGRHSGFPVCCIAWFVARSASGWVWLVHNRYWYQRWLDRQGADRPLAHQYVRCPVCVVRGRWVDMHICDAMCEGVVGACRTIR